MKVLLKEGAKKATATTILILPRLDGKTLETLAGKAVPHGIVAEADDKAVLDAVNACDRTEQFISGRDLYKAARWMYKALGEYENGSKMSLEQTDRGNTLDDSEAKRINRVEGLTKGDTIAVGPTISPRTFLNARGRVVSIKGDKVEVKLDAGDRDRIERATGNLERETIPFPLVCVEKLV
jgi:hypothetical protein